MVAFAVALFLNLVILSFGVVVAVCFIVSRKFINSGLNMR